MRRLAPTFATLLAIALASQCSSGATPAFGNTEQPLPEPTPTPSTGSRDDLRIELKESALELLEREGIITIRDGAIFHPPDFRVPTEPILVEKAESTATFFWSQQLEEVQEEDWPTMGCVLDQICEQSRCDSDIQNIRQSLGDFPSGAIAAGVTIEPRVVATNKHVAQNLRYSIDDVRVAFGFRAPHIDEFSHQRDLQVHTVERICYPKGMLDLALVELDDHRPLPPAQPIEPDLSALDQPLPVVAFGHPMGASRLMTGNDEHTRIQRCENDEVHATLDSLKRSSGSPVYIPHGSDGDWILLGLLSGNEEVNFTFLDNTYGIRVSPLPYAPCALDSGVGPLITPLSTIEEDITTFSRGDEPEGWICYVRSPDGIQPGCPGTRACSAAERRDVIRCID